MQIVEDCDKRLTESQIQEIVELTNSTLPPGAHLAFAHGEEGTMDEGEGDGMGGVYEAEAGEAYLDEEQEEGNGTMRFP